MPNDIYEDGKFKRDPNLVPGIHAPSSSAPGAGGVRKRLIMLAMPTCLEACTSGLASFFFTLGGLSNDPDFPFAFTTRFLSGNSTISYPVAYGRNYLVSKFLAEPEAEFLWFVDSDTLPSENSLRLLSLVDKADIVGGIYPIPGSREDPIVWGVYDRVPTEKGFRPMNILMGEDVDPVREAGAIATGCMIISRKVLEDMDLRLDKESELPSVFRTVARVDGKVTSTDDMDFCLRVSEQGKYKMLCDTSVRWGHVKTRDVRAQWAAMVDSFEIGLHYADTQHTSSVRPFGRDQSIRPGDARFQDNGGAETNKPLIVLAQ